MAHTVFICHSARDKQVADAACAALEARRIPCWIAPRDILGGDEWGKAIVDAINDCRIVLLIFSAHANSSPQVRREVERAVSKAKIIVPFRIEDVLPSDAMEYALGNTHWLDALTPPVEAHLTALADTISRILQRDEPTEPIFTQHPPPRKEPPPAPPQPAPIVTVPPLELGTEIFPPEDAGTRKKRRASSLIFAVVLLGAPCYFLWHRASAKPASAILALSSTPMSTTSSPTSTETKPLPHPPKGPASSATSKPTSPNQTGSIGNSKQSNQETTNSPADAQFRARMFGPSTTPAPQTASAAEDFQRGDAFYNTSNFEDARPFLEGACTGGNLRACSELGFLYQYGKAVSEDIPKAIALYRKACYGGDAPGCSDLGLMYQLGAGVSHSNAQAIALYRKACDGDDADGCYQLGYMYDDVEGVSPDHAQAVVLFRKACDHGLGLGCSSLGVMYERGEGVSRDLAQAIALYRKGCNSRDALGCQNLKRLQP